MEQARNAPGDLQSRETHRAIDKPVFYDPLKSEEGGGVILNKGGTERGGRSNHQAQHFFALPFQVSSRVLSLRRRGRVEIGGRWSALSHGDKAAHLYFFKFRVIFSEDILNTFAKQGT